MGRVDVEMRVLEVVKELDGPPTFSAVNHNSLSLVQRSSNPSTEAQRIATEHSRAKGVPTITKRGCRMRWVGFLNPSHGIAADGARMRILRPPGRG
jgi:hypothetical protein